MTITEAIAYLRSKPYDQKMREIAELLEEMTWQPIETAPKDGTCIQAVIPGHGSDNVIAWQNGLRDSEDQDCGGWCFMEDQEPPDDWTDGICWAFNEDGVASTNPTHWMPLPKHPTAPSSEPPHTQIETK